MDKNTKRKNDYEAPKVKSIRVAVYRVLCNSVDGNPTGKGENFNEPEYE